MAPVPRPRALRPRTAGDPPRHTSGPASGGAPPGRVGVAVVLLLLGLLLAAAPPAPGATAGPDPVGTWPLRPEPRVLQGFAPPADPWGAGHRGVDLLGRSGQRVRAALPGTVSFAARIAGRGVVVVDHGPTRTTYEPVTASVAVGDLVVLGATLGSLEHASSHCRPRACLHWGWIEGAETYLDPLRLVGGGPVRLLPLWRAEPVDAGPAAGPAASPLPVLARMPPGPLLPWWLT